ncbi:MAG: hypothetical protein HKN76_10265 [Saprospiraceae bacterium]|nr:hypothetical protein [Saprospiraceae bacterium]
MRILRSLALIILFAINLHGNSHNVYTKSAVYNEWYESFLSAAQWCGSNLPDDAFLMSIKPRIVYLYSGLKGMPMVSERDIYSIGYAELKLKEIKENQVTHLIVDAISNSTKKNIYPILNSNKEKFEAIPIANLNDKCTVVEVLDW